MSQLDLTNIPASSIPTPAAGLTSCFVDPIDKTFRRKNDVGYVNMYQNNVSLVAQVVPAAVRTYIIGSNFKVSSNKLQAGSSFRWIFNMTKTAAGVAASTFDVCFGTNGTTADVARLTFAKPAGTAAVDEGVVTITCTIRSIGAAGVPVGQFTLIHNGNTVGHATIPIVCVNNVGAGFDTTTVTNVGVCLTSGAADAITIQTLQAEVWDV